MARQLASCSPDGILAIIRRRASTRANFRPERSSPVKPRLRSSQLLSDLSALRGWQASSEQKSETRSLFAPSFFSELAKVSLSLPRCHITRSSAALSRLLLGSTTRKRISVAPRSRNRSSPLEKIPSTNRNSRSSLCKTMEISVRLAPLHVDSAQQRNQLDPFSVPGSCPPCDTSSAASRSTFAETLAVSGRGKRRRKRPLRY